MMRSTNVRRGWPESVGRVRTGHLLGSLALVFLGGCGGSGLPGPSAPTGNTISGTVTWQGKPLPLGSINFVPAAAGEGVWGNKATITNGHYEVPDPPGLTPGSYKVRIHARGNLKKQGPVSELPKGIPDFNPVNDPLLQEQIPEQYNDQTTLTAETGPGANTKDFDLKGVRSAAKGRRKTGTRRDPM